MTVKRTDEQVEKLLDHIAKILDVSKRKAYEVMEYRDAGSEGGC
ncbi:hypothetical protein J2Z48_001782 [Croceifilum oryzae]|uniref:Uncharacterized protein n=1 Tax=Croceifilum oryzae TaxID=1553429 RepID=A0AAJ1TFN5_9BACL|nr:hypothetical protein [Croceifilum oryzae]MDQ0417609.1 hypothetical protein [Croceifilum oryzae]